jgi:hypothetical protein
MWPPPPLTGLWLPTGSGFWRPPPQPYPSQPSGTPPSQTGQGYWPSPMPWGAPPRGQASPPFGLPLLRTPPLRPTTSTPCTVKQAYVKIGFVCLLNYFTFLARSIICLSGHLRITTKRRAGIPLCRRPLQPGGRIRRQ